MAIQIWVLHNLRKNHGDQIPGASKPLQNHGDQIPEASKTFAQTMGIKSRALQRLYRKAANRTARNRARKGTVNANREPPKLRQTRTAMEPNLKPRP